MHHPNGEARDVWLIFDIAFGVLGGMSSDAEDDLFLSPMRRSEHIVEIFTLCSFAHYVCSRLLQGFFYTKTKWVRWL